MVDNEAFSFHISELLAVLVKLLALLTLPNLLDLPEWMELRSELLNKMNSVSITKLKTLRDWLRYLRKKKPQAHLKDKIISHFLKNFILGFRNFNTYMDRRVVNRTNHFIKWRFTWNYIFSPLNLLIYIPDVYSSVKWIFAGQCSLPHDRHRFSSYKHGFLLRFLLSTKPERYSCESGQ